MKTCSTWWTSSCGVGSAGAVHTPLIKGFFEIKHQSGTYTAPPHMLLHDGDYSIRTRAEIKREYLFLDLRVTMRVRPRMIRRVSCCSVHLPLPQKPWSSVARDVRLEQWHPRPACGPGPIELRQVFEYQHSRIFEYLWIFKYSRIFRYCWAFEYQRVFKCRWIYENWWVFKYRRAFGGSLNNLSSKSKR